MQTDIYYDASAKKYPTAKIHKVLPKLKRARGGEGGGLAADHSLLYGLYGLAVSAS